MVANPALDSPYCEQEVYEHEKVIPSMYLVKDSTLRAPEFNRIQPQAEIVWIEGTVSVAF